MVTTLMFGNTDLNLPRVVSMRIRECEHLKGYCCAGHTSMKHSGCTIFLSRGYFSNGPLLKSETFNSSA